MKLADWKRDLLTPNLDGSPKEPVEVMALALIALVERQHEALKVVVENGIFNTNWADADAALAEAEKWGL